MSASQPASNAQPAKHLITGATARAHKALMTLALAASSAMLTSNGTLKPTDVVTRQFNALTVNTWTTGLMLVQVVTLIATAAMVAGANVISAKTPVTR